MTENRLTVVRHGETEWSRDGRHTGRTDVPLTDSGRSVARKLAQALVGRTYALVLTSPMGRARETAALAGFSDATVDDDLREWDYGDYEGRTTADIRGANDHDWFLWDDGVPNGETLDDVAARADRVIKRVRAVDGEALVFAHGHFLRVLASRWLELDPGFGRHLVLSPATLSILGWERQAPAIEAWNAAVD
jgi:broad specificity phosphatase PhoE